MRKIKEVLRLFHEVGLGQREIARCVQLSQSTVHEYLERARAAELGWPLPEVLDDRAIEDRLFPATHLTEKRYPIRDYKHIDEELRTHSNLTLQLLWEEYRRAHADGCCYSRFCVLYRRWKKKQAVVLRQQHKPGEKLFLDWAGGYESNPRCLRFAPSGLRSGPASDNDNYPATNESSLISIRNNGCR